MGRTGVVGSPLSHLDELLLDRDIDGSWRDTISGSERYSLCKLGFVHVYSDDAAGAGDLCRLHDRQPDRPEAEHGYGAPRLDVGVVPDGAPTGGHAAAKQAQAAATGEQGNEQKWEVVNILARRKVANQDEYKLKVQWKNWKHPKTNNDWTWEPESSLKHLEIVDKPHSKGTHQREERNQSALEAQQRQLPSDGFTRAWQLEVCAA